MNIPEEKTVIAQNASIGMQRECAIKQFAGVQERLEKKGVGAAFHRAAKADPVGDMGFMGSIAFHAMICGPLEGLIGNLPVGHLELDGGVLTLESLIEGISALDEARERSVRRPKSAFYPLGRNKKSIVAEKKKDKAAHGRSSRFSADVQAELAFMFELADILNKAEEGGAIEANNKQLHLIVRKSASQAYQGVERRRRPRPEGMFNA